jgi:hypothetical protein
MATRGNMFKIWFEPAAVPLYVIVSSVLCISGTALYNASRAPDVVWRHHANPFPWQAIDPAASEHVSDSLMHRTVHLENRKLGLPNADAVPQEGPAKW